MKIGFTVGVWDLFHKGHINFLSDAKKHCDYLVVGIMNDFWVRIQKNHERPAESLEQRIVKLRESGLSDRIIVLDTLDMHPYLQMVDVWIKGDDQKNMRPSDWAGKQVYIKRTPDISTTLVIEGE